MAAICLGLNVFSDSKETNVSASFKNTIPLVHIHHDGHNAKLSSPVQAHQPLAPAHGPTADQHNWTSPTTTKVTLHTGPFVTLNPNTGQKNPMLFSYNYCPITLGHLASEMEMARKCNEMVPQESSFNPFTHWGIQNGRHFTDNTFKYIFLNENVIILDKISLKFGLKGPINNIPALVQIMAWHRPGDKPLSEPMMVRLPTHTCVTHSASMS